MDYAAHYNALIERARDRELQEYAERHHVVPRCLGGKDDPDNIVRLTPEEHYVAHQLLIKLHPESRGLVFAASQMAGRPGNKLYGWVRRKLAAARRGTRQSPEHIRKLAAVRRGRKLSAEHKAKIAATLNGTARSAETRRIMSAAAQKRGVSQTTRAAAVAWLTGRSRGPLTEDTKQKIGEANRGRKHSEEARAKMRRSHRGVHLSEGHKAAIGAALRGKKRRPYNITPRPPRIISEETRAKMAAAKLGKKRRPHSPETKAKISAAHTGKPKPRPRRAKDHL
jgi:hypothetical protein